MPLPTELPLRPDDIGAYCPDVPDAISLRAASRERARDLARPMTEAEAFAELVEAYWRGEFRGSVFTLERLEEREPASDEDWDHDTLIRRAVYWTPDEYAGFVARFWDFGAAEVDLPNLPSAEDLLRWLAALPIAQYPPASRAVLDRLQISLAALRCWSEGVEPRPEASRERPYWTAAEAELLNSLDQEGEPQTLAEIERRLAEYLKERGQYPAESTLREHARRCRDQHRQSRRGLG